jgi:cytochrome c oxidase subunit I+III
LGDDFPIKRWLTTTNHKEIGILYLITSFYFLVVAGVLAMTFRIQLFGPGLDFLTASSYNQAVTMHGLIMILWVLSPMAFGFANYFVPIQIGARDMAFPRLNAMSYWFFLFSGIMAVSSFFLPGGAPDVGWTAYAPLNTAKFTPQIGMTVGALALVMMIVSITMSTVNFTATILRMRATGMTWSRLPLFTWSILYTVVMMLFAFPSLIAGLLLLSSDRILGTIFFTSLEGGDLLWEHLFWFFGHPEVYIVLTPALGVLFEIVPVQSRRPIYGKKYILGALAVATLISFVVWVHHMFTTTIDPTVKMIFSATTIAISLPFEIIAIYLIATLVRGSIRLNTPMLFSLGSIFVFIVGGITGVFNASIALDYQLRGSLWVVAHFHYVMAGTVLFAFFAALYYWFPKMSGKMYSERLGKIHFVLSFIGFNILYFPMFFLFDMPRRIFTYPADLGWSIMNHVATIGGFIFGITQILLFVNMFRSVKTGSVAEMNPWKGWTLEWTIPSPPPAHNFDVTPDMTEGSVMMTNGGSKGERYVGKANYTALPLTLAIGTMLALFGLAVSIPIGSIGFVIVIASLAFWFKDDILGRFASEEDKIGHRWPFERVPREKLGLWVLLTSEMMLFGMVISAYIFVRAHSHSWPSPLLVEDILRYLTGGVVTVPHVGEMVVHNIVLGASNTIILLTSSLSIVLALNSIRNGSIKGLKIGLLATFFLGSAFLVIKGVEWMGLFSEGFTITSGLPSATFFVSTGLHGGHVIAGLIAISYLIIKTFKNGFTKEKHIGVEHVGLYWHMVDIVWLFLFPLFYLM